MRTYKKILLVGASTSLALPAVLATSALDNGTLSGLPQVGSDVGHFMKNLAPGVGAFIIVLGVFGGVASIIYGVVSMIKNKISI